MNEIAAAILEHAKAMRELAQAIREHTYSLSPPDDEEESGPPCYMDGSPIIG